MSKVVNNTLIYSIGNLITALSAFILLPIYTKYLSIEDFGIVSSMQTLSAILVIIVSLALERSIFRIYYDYKSEDEKRRFLGTIFIGLLFIGVISVSILFLFKKYIDQIFPSVPFSPYYSYTILNTFILSIINFAQTISQVKQDAKRFIITSLALFFLTAFVNLFFIINRHQGAIGIITGSLIAGAIVVLFVLYYIVRGINFSFDISKFRAAIKFSLPMLPTLLSAWVMNVSDRVFIAHYFTQTDVGIYSLAYRIASLVTLASSALFMAYNPIFYKVANDDQLSARERNDTIFRYNKIITITIGIIGILVLGASDIGIKIFFKKQFYSAYSYVPVFIIAFIVSQISGLLNLMLYQAKKTWQVTCAVIISAALNVILNYFFIPIFGVYFAVISTIFCNSFSFIILYYFTRKGYYIKLDWKSLSLILGFCLLIIIENYMLKTQSVVLNVLVKFMTLGILILFFKSFISQLLSLLKYKKIDL
ncbi:MAG TPA: oligosaccharide flippase family protein [Ferruginibacter sp.]|jgi:O-antigen/teichoic acid export membrane protein|nr:oligosaccharide flippase family protein [Ferruginibacter sp.]